ncbi:MAG: ABC transporter ATP-binding protein, partial [Deltaproteobacteria bacterium]|nr:ABC transporter ATP-binding protein [Deltaproteobacteria bacterium]
DMSKLERSDLLVLRQDDVTGIAKTAVIFLCVLATGFLLNFLQVYLVERTSQRIMHDIRMAIFEHLQKLSLAFFHANPVGRLVTRATNDVQNLHEMFNALFANIVKDLLLIAGITGVLFWINWRLGLVCYAVLPLLLIGTIYFSSKSRSAFRLVRIKVAVLNAQISENLAGISVVKAFCREQLNEKRFHALNEENYVANMRQTVVFAVFSPLVDLARLSAIALIIWYGGGQTIRDAITLGTLVIFLYYVRMFFRPIQDLAEKYNIIQSAFASLERIYLLFIDASFIDEPDSPLAARKLKGRIDFQNVSFSYNNREQVLQDVTLNVKAGETIAIVGPTGAGKTTIINLLERFYDVQQGVILIDGSNIMHMEKRLLRRSIGLVMQDVFLFGGTIRNNITLGREYSEAEIARALAVSNANEVIARLPHGLDEEINQGGKTLSSGERQLLAFARAVILDPVILVFDEATSNIDPLTEGLIQNALEKIMLDRTCIVIAHRFSTIRNADRIVVMHKGRIHEEGSHDELIRAGGMYTRLARLQQLEHAAV